MIACIYLYESLAFAPNWNGMSGRMGKKQKKKKEGRLGILLHAERIGWADICSMDGPIQDLVMVGGRSRLVGEQYRLECV